MRSLRDQIANKCVHFTGIDNDTCRAGVEYKQFRSAETGYRDRLPCHRKCAHIACEHREFPSEAEVQRQLDAHEKAAAKMFGALDAVHADAKARGLRKGHGGTGAVKCPNCGGEIAYSVASFNGHIWGKCSTVGCVAWMQ